MERENDKPQTVPIYVYDDIAVRNERREKVHWAFHIIQTVLLVAVVVAFLLYLNQYEYVSNESVTVDGADGVANYVGKDGTIYNGEDRGEAVPLSGEEERESESHP